MYLAFIFGFLGFWWFFFGHFRLVREEGGRGQGSLPSVAMPTLEE